MCLIVILIWFFLFNYFKRKSFATGRMRPARLDPAGIDGFCSSTPKVEDYPRLPVVVRQLIAAPLELIAAAGIIYFVLPETGNPGFLVVLGAFMLSFSAGLLSNPGGRDWRHGSRFSGAFAFGAAVRPSPRSSSGA